MDGQMDRGMNGCTDGRVDFPEPSCVGARSPGCMKTAHLPERMKKMPETKARMVLWGRMCPMLLRINPMNMKKRLTRGNGVAERIISEEEDKRTPSASRGLPRCLPSSGKTSWQCLPAVRSPELHLQMLPGCTPSCGGLGPPRALSLSPEPVESVLTGGIVLQVHPTSQNQLWGAKARRSVLLGARGLDAAP